MARAQADRRGICQTPCQAPAHCRREGTSQTETDREAVDNFNSVEQRVLGWIENIAARMAADSVPPVNPKRFYALISSMAAGNFLVDDTKRADNQGWFGKGDISLLQLMLRRSLQIEENQHRGMAPDSAKMAKIRKLKVGSDRRAKEATRRVIVFAERDQWSESVSGSGPLSEGKRRATGGYS